MFKNSQSIASTFTIFNVFSVLREDLAGFEPAKRQSCIV